METLHLGIYMSISSVLSWISLRSSFVAQLVKNLPAMQKPQFNPWVRKIPWRREQLPTPVFLPGEFHGQRNWTGDSLWGSRVGPDWETHFSGRCKKKKKKLNFSYLNILKVWVLRNLVENFGCICLALFLLANYLHITLSFSSTNSSYICLYDTEALGSCINLLAISNHKQLKFIFSRFLRQEGKDKVSGG